MDLQTHTPPTPPRPAPALHTGVLSWHMLLLTPFHHGAGVEGNTMLLRTQEVIVEEHGCLRKVPVPFLSGQSQKSELRRAGVHFALRAMGVEPGSLPKEVVSLLFSGGNLSSKGSSGVDLTRARQMAALAPILSVCGYASGASIDAAKIAVLHGKLVCAENAPMLRPKTHERLPAAVREVAHFYRGDEFGTRMEGSRNPHIRHFLAPADTRRIEEAVSARGDKKAKESDQMIYNFQTLLAGSWLEGGLTYTNLTDMEMAALRSAFFEMTLDEHDHPMMGRGYVMRVAAKGNVGFGRVAMFMDHVAKIQPEAPTYQPAPALVKHGDAGASRDMGAGVDEQMRAYTRHLYENRAEILDFLQSAA